MTDWRDVMVARGAADAAARLLDAYGGSVEESGDSDPTLATLLAASAICAELRALGTALTYLKGGD